MDKQIKISAFSDELAQVRTKKKAGMPVMEGKCVLFKAFGDVDALPLCVKTKDVDEFVNAVYLISGSLGGINLEDIAAPGALRSSAS